MIALLATRYSAAHTDIIADFELLSIKGQDRGTVRLAGEETAFRIVTREEHLEGLELKNFYILAHAMGRIDSKLIRIAAARTR